MASNSAFAQSTGTEAAEETVVTVRGQKLKSINGALTKENVGKSRSTVTQDFIENQASGQTILQSLNLVPGVNFTNNDPYGSSGGNIRIRGFDGNRISLTFDGAPLNDTGNYAIYSNQQLDPELIERASVNLGTTDVDSPTASAAGGTVSYVTLKPSNDFGVNVNASVGDWNFRRVFALLNTGEFANGYTAFFSFSSSINDKFKGPGEINKTQYNARLYKAMDNGDFFSAAFNFNKNRNYNYRNLTVAQFAATPDLDNDTTCSTPIGVNGTAQSAASCTNYYGHRINPSDTGSLRLQYKRHLGDNLIFTFDPSFQYVLANGGTQFENVNEKNSRLDLDGTDTTGVGVDLNRDGDTLDTVMLFRPSNTNTHRYGLTTSLIWDLNDSNRIRGAYTLDYGRHRQTGAFGYMTSFGEPVDIWGGRDNPGNAVKDRNGNVLQNRNRFSIAKLEQFALEYRGRFFEDALTVNIGVRAPKLTRELNNYCYQPSGADFPRCTTEAATVVTASGNVTLPSTGSTQYVPPTSYKREYDQILPNLSANWTFAESQSLYMSYAEQISAPRTDNLYKYSRAAAAGSPLVTSIAEPETTQTFDLGYRYQTADLLLSAALWSTKFQNRIVNTYDPETLLSADRNVGDVEMSGFDTQVGWQINKAWSVYGSASYNKSELQSDLQLTSTTFLATKGKKLVETPDWTYSSRVEWNATDAVKIGLQAKYVGKRYYTDLNDQSVDPYTVADLDVSYDFFKDTAVDAKLQLNVINLFDEKYLGSLGTANSGTGSTHSVGSPRTTMLTLKTTF
jgi:iron complex outermembrane receptor protein